VNCSPAGSLGFLGFDAASFAAWSARSLPSTPSWPGVHSFTLSMVRNASHCPGPVVLSLTRRNAAWASLNTTAFGRPAFTAIRCAILTPLRYAVKFRVVDFLVPSEVDSSLAPLPLLGLPHDSSSGPASLVSRSVRLYSHCLLVPSPCLLFRNRQFFGPRNMNVGLILLSLVDGRQLSVFENPASTR